MRPMLIAKLQDLWRPLSTPRVISGTPANLSGLSAGRRPLRLARCPQLLAALSGGHGANVSGSTLIYNVFAAEEK